MPVHSKTTIHKTIRFFIFSFVQSGHWNTVPRTFTYWFIYTVLCQKTSTFLFHVCYICQKMNFITRDYCPPTFTCNMCFVWSFTIRMVIHNQTLSGLPKGQIKWIVWTWGPKPQLIIWAESCKNLLTWLPTRSDKNGLYSHRRWLHVGLYKSEGLYCKCSENKGADQLRSYCAGDLCLCFRIWKVRFSHDADPKNSLL